jgi:hypothetical protein
MMFGALLVSAETRYVAWDELDLDEDTGGFALPGRTEDYTARAEARGGIEIAPPAWPVRLRGGYAFEPLVYDLLLGDAARRVRDRHTISAGAGMLFGDSFALDAMASFSSLERAVRDEPGVREELRDRAIRVTGSYRY